MDVVGNGFLAGILSRIGSAHPGVTVLAAGVSTGVQVPESDYRREADLVRAVARRCRSEGRLLVYPSTASAGMYGAPGCAGREDEDLVPASRYGWHKLEMEQLIRDSDADYLILRLGNVTGPGQPRHQLVPALIDQLLSGRVTVHRAAYRDLVDAADVAGLTHALLTAGAVREVVNISSGMPVPIEMILRRLECGLGVHPEHEYVDAPSGRYAVSLAKLRRLVPGAAAVGFGPYYYRAVIDRYLAAQTPGVQTSDAHTADALAAGASSPSGGEISNFSDVRILMG